jgi:RNA polymerase sigma-70 factor (ECF subfamily)
MPGTYPSPQSQAIALDINQAIHAAREGDAVAFTQLVNTYCSAAQRVAYHILRTEEAAADAVQEAWIKVHRAIHRFEDGNFRAWLLRIVTNTCYDYLRRQKRRPSVSLDELMEATHTEPASHKVIDPEKALLRLEEREQIFRAIEQLAPWHREVVLLVDVEGYDYSEAADLLHVPLGTVKSRLSRARAALRDEFVQMGLIPQT